MQRRIAHKLIVLALCSFVMGLLTTVCIQAREMARQAAGLSNLKRLGAATQCYAEIHDGQLPPLDNMETARTALAPFLSGNGSGAWKIPGVPEGYFQPNATLGKKRLASMKKPEDMVLFYESCSKDGISTYGPRVAFADGHVKCIHASLWPEVAIQSGIMPYISQGPNQTWELHLGEAILLLSLELFAVAGVLGAASLLTRKH
ncbi:MAG: hypothetical protein QM758_30410 [Armatimonas sp.]